MKLNLVPTTVTRQRKAKSAWVISALMIVAGIGGAAFMIITSGNALKDAKAQVDEKRPQAEAVASTASKADEIIKDASGVLLNTNLATTMMKHNSAYPDLYDEVTRYIPPFYRINSLSAAPGADGKSTTITMVGTLDSYQQYNDLALALLRMPKATTVSRSGYVGVRPYRPELTANDQVGKMRKPGEAPIPDDQLEQIQYFQAAVKPDGYLNVGSFGAEETTARGAMPDSSLVTIRLVVERDLRTPNPRATLTTGATGAAAASAPSAPSAPAAASTPPASSSSQTMPSVPAKGGKGKASDEDGA